MNRITTQGDTEFLEALKPNMVDVYKTELSYAYNTINNHTNNAILQIDSNNHRPQKV